MCDVFKVKRSKVKVTGHRSRGISADKNATTLQWMVISTSDLVGIIDMGVEACGILSRSVGQKTGSRNMADIQHIKCKNERKNVAELLKFCTLIGNRGRRIERRCVNLHGSS